MVSGQNGFELALLQVAPILTLHALYSGFGARSLSVNAGLTVRAGDPSTATNPKLSNYTTLLQLYICLQSWFALAYRLTPNVSPGYCCTIVQPEQLGYFCVGVI